MTTPTMSNLEEIPVDELPSKRPVKFTEKGRVYNMVLLREKMASAHRKLKSIIELVEPMLRSGPENLDNMRSKYKEWSVLYEYFMDNHDELRRLLKPEESDTEPSQVEILSQLSRFKTRVIEWIANNERKLSDNRSVVSSSKRSRRSSRSSIASSVSTQLIKERQKQAELAARATALQQKQTLQQRKLLLEQEEEAFQLKTEIDVANARTKVLNDVAIDDDHYRATILDPTSTPFVPKSGGIYYLDNDNYGGQPNFDNTPQHPGLTIPVTPIPVHPRAPVQNGDALSVVSGVSKRSDEMMVSMVRHLRKPPTEIKKFDGDPMDFRRFIRQFNSKVVMNSDDKDEMMNYLDLYTSGEVNRIVLSYSHLDAEIGYPAVMKELDERYGDPQMVANAYIKKALDWNPIKPDGAKALDAFSIFLSECECAVKSVDAVKILEYSENMKLLVKKLPFYLHDRWRSLVQQSREKGKTMKFHDLVEFIKKESKKANDPIYGKDQMSTGRDRLHQKKEIPSTSKKVSCTVNAQTVEETVEGQSSVGAGSPRKNDGVTRPCICCKKDDHSLDNCEIFKKKTWDEKKEFVKKSSLCFGCLKYGHVSKFCRSRLICKTCQKKHPTILHYDRNSTTSTNMGLTVKLPEIEPSINSGLTDSPPSTMAIIPVRVMMKDGTQVVDTYAFMDNGSNACFGTDNLMKKIGATGRKTKVKLDTMGQSQILTSSMVKGIRIMSLNGDDGYVDLPLVYTKEKMPVDRRHIPTQDDLNQWSHLKDISLPVLDSTVDLLIGNNVPDAYTPMEVKTGPPGSPHASKTRLGWLTWGVIRHQGDRPMTVNSIDLKSAEESRELNELVKRSIMMDFPEKAINDRKENSYEDQLFLKMVSKSIKFDGSHYVIDLPFRDRDIVLPDNSEMVARQLASLKKKFDRNPQFKTDYDGFMNTIISKNFAEEVPDSQLKRRDGRVWYIPHHGVYHAKKNKIRVVFNCTAKFYGVSLNDLLLPGPDMINNLCGVLLRFRQEDVAIMSDIEKMYYQVRVPEHDRDCLRFFWWPEGDLTKEPKSYRMTVHLFGSVSSGSCANFALKQTAIDNSEHYSKEVVDCLKKNFYVDDCLESCPDEDSAISMTTDLSSLCARGGFRLTQWSSSSKNVLEAIKPEDRGDPDKVKERALGTAWFLENDEIGFNANLENQTPSRRGILSTTSSVYDPLGLISPYILPAKILLQDLGRKELGWDDLIDGDELQRWSLWSENLNNLMEIRIPRCYKPPGFGKVVDTQLHNFSDASCKGFGFSTYIRLTSDTGQIHCTLVTAKSRVAPSKKVTVPRLELTAAALMAKNYVLLLQELELKFDKVNFWTDSVAVLRYIANKTTRFRTFVANRLTTIRDVTEVDQWKYIETKMNPADYASRGLMVTDKKEHQSCWFNGPTFLWDDESKWPSEIRHFD